MSDTHSENTLPQGPLLEHGHILAGISDFFSKLDSTPRPVAAYPATILTRCLAVFAALWLALEGAYCSSPGLMPLNLWFYSFISTSMLAFLLSDRLSDNLPKLSMLLQFAAIFAIGISLVQGCLFGILPPGVAWVLPGLTLAPALYLAVRRNLECFALAAYLFALLTPLLLGIPQIHPTRFFAYYLMLCLPLPFLGLLRYWRYLNLCVFGWVLGVGCYYLASFYRVVEFERALAFFALFFTCYFFVVWARVVKAPFSVLNFEDFIFSVGLALGAILCQLRIAVSSPGALLPSVIGLMLVFFAVGALARYLWGQQARSLSRVYIFIAFLLLNCALALLWPGTVALAVYCLQAVFLFAFGSYAGMMRVKAGGFIILMLTPLYFFTADLQMILGVQCIAISAICCAFMQDRERKRLAMRSGKKPWSSQLELFLVAYCFIWCFLGIAVFVFREMPSPGLVYFALSSAGAYLFYALGKLVRLRSLRVAIFIPMLASVPAALLPFIYQSYLEWPVFDHLVSYNYLSGLGALAWITYFITVWTAMYHNWGGLISNRIHSRLLALVTLELVLVVTSSSRAFALEYGISPSWLSVLAVVPSIFCIFLLAHIMKRREVEHPYRRPLFLVVPWVLFASLALWFVSALTSLGAAAPGGKYIPLLNPVELVQLSAIGTFLYWQHSLRKHKYPTPHLSSGKRLWVYGISSFLWLHGVMFRVVQYFSQAQVQEVFGFAELRIIFVCIWIIYGIIVWVAASAYSSAISWLIGFVLFVAGSIGLIHLGLDIWGQFVAIVMSVSALIILALLLWRSPAPFTQRGKKLASRAY